VREYQSVSERDDLASVIGIGITPHFPTISSNRKFVLRPECDDYCSIGGSYLPIHVQRHYRSDSQQDDSLRNCVEQGELPFFPDAP
jgi:hypothetical protein